MSNTVDVAVVGGGIIGLAVAWRARQAGLSVTLLERASTGAGASHAAAGMLAPVAEVEFGEAGRRVLELGLRSAAMWPDFATALEEASGIEVSLRRSGTLVVARDADEARELERQIAFRDSLHLRTERLLPSAARELEPALAPTVRLALAAPDDHSVDPRLVLTALRRACEVAGVALREHTPVAGVELDATGARAASAGESAVRESATGESAVGESATGESAVGESAAGESAAGAPDAAVPGRVVGVRLQSGELLPAATVVLAAGAWTSQLQGLPARARIPVRPVKGQILRLRDPAGPGLLRRVVRFHGGYLVPRGDGRYVLGATMEERGFELSPTAGGVYELLRDASELVPGLSELHIEELGVGLRPSTPSNAPAVGPGALAGLLWATGHHRNGILLAPLTAELLAGELSGLPADPLLSLCDPRRFAGAHPSLPMREPLLL